MPARTQITRHDCVEGWSAIGKWTGLPPKLMFDAGGALPAARYAVSRQLGYKQAKYVMRVDWSTV